MKQNGEGVQKGKLETEGSKYSYYLVLSFSLGNWSLCFYSGLVFLGCRNSLSSMWHLEAKLSSLIHYITCICEFYEFSILHLLGPSGTSQTTSKPDVLNNITWIYELFTCSSCYYLIENLILPFIEQDQVNPPSKLQINIGSRALTYSMRKNGILIEQVHYFDV